MFMSLLITGVFAQENDTEETVKEKKPVNNNYFGVKAGVNYAGMSQKDFKNSDKLIGPNVGLFFESRQTERLSFLFEINYSRKGGSVKNDLVENKYTLNYIDVPLMLNYYPIRNLSVGAGFQPTIFWSGDYDSKNLTTNVTTSGSVPKGNVYPVGLTFVAGVNYKITESFNVDLKYSPAAHLYKGIRHNALTLRVGYAIAKNAN